MNEPTRRRLLASTALLLGLGAGCQELEGSGGVQGTNINESSPSGDVVTNIHVDETMADLPRSPDGLAFGVTGDGLFRFHSDEDAWVSVQYGSKSAPAPSMNTVEATVGSSPSGRPLISNEDTTVYVDPDSGSDDAAGTEHDPLETIREAVQRAPIYLRNQYVVDLATAPNTPVTYDEDVLVPTVIGTGQAGKEADAPDSGPFINFVLQGESDDASAVQIGSLMFGNLLGTSAGTLSDATIIRDSPYDDEGFGVSAYGDGEVKIINIGFTDGPTNGLLAYGARMKARNVDFGQESLEIGLKAKRHASAVVHNPTGVVSGDGFRAASNSTISVLQDRSVTGSPLFRTLRGGLIYDGIDDAWIGISGTETAAVSSAQSGTPVQNAHVHPASPDDVTRGDIWYENGSGDRREGFYGQTEDGPVRMS